MINAQTFTIDSREMLDKLHAFTTKLPKDNLFSWDIETDSANEQLANLYGFGFCFSEDKAFYIPWRKPDGTVIWSEEEQKEIKDWLENTCKNFRLIGHNLSFDVLTIEKNLGLDLSMYIYADTLLMKHTTDEERPFGLKENAVKELGEWADKAQDDLKTAVLAAGGQWKMKQKDMYLAPTAILAEYCCWDVLLTLKLFNIYQQRIEDQGLVDLFYNDEVMHLYREVTIPMKRRGVRIDLPHFQQINKEIEADIERLNDKIQKDIADDVYDFTQGILDDKVPVKPKGNFPKILAQVLKAPLPVNKAGKITLASRAIKKQKEATGIFDFFYDWITGDVDKLIVPDTILNGKCQMLSALYDNNPDINYKPKKYKNKKELLREAQEKAYFNLAVNKEKGMKYVFKLTSNDHLAELIFNIHGFPIDPKKKTAGGKPQVDESVLSNYSDSLDIIDDLLTLKKLNKIHGTYISGVLDRQIDGRIYASLLQFGTTSGRFASRNPNLQNLPRVPEKDPSTFSLVEKYQAAIRKGFISDDGCSLIDADYSALEPRCFSHVSGDVGLQQLWAKGEDMYSRIAIDVFDLPNISANPKDANYLKKVDPPYRQKSKVFSLAVPYGAEEGQISKSMNVPRNEAKGIIDKYLNAYPGLKQYMNRCNYEAKTKGYVTTEFGRVRHLPKAKTLYAMYGNDLLDYQWAKRNRLLDERRQFKNLLNNAKNFPIQGLAAHIVNRGMITIAREIKRLDIDAYICLTVHDQVIVNCPNEHLSTVSTIVQKCLEDTTKITVELIAEPEIANNMADSH